MDSASVQTVQPRLDGSAPAHVGIIMDGNGRWAKARGMPRSFGHKAGLEAVRRTVRAVPDFSIDTLTLYAFSSENWSRPPAEVRDLMGLLRLFVRRDLAELSDNGVRVRIIGRRDNLDPDILSIVNEAEDKTALNGGLNLNIAFNYGGRDEIARAVNRIVAQRLSDPSGPLAGLPVTEGEISAALDTAFVPDPDLIIRTSGETRVSNFLTWQSAYSEFLFMDCLWPDFGAEHLREALEAYALRDRRFGGLTSASKVGAVS